MIDYSMKKFSRSYWLKKHGYFVKAELVREIVKPMDFVSIESNKVNEKSIRGNLMEYEIFQELMDSCICRWMENISAYSKK